MTMQTGARPHTRRPLPVLPPARAWVGLIVTGVAAAALLIGIWSYAQKPDAPAGDPTAPGTLGGGLSSGMFERFGDIEAYADATPARSMDPEQLTPWMDTMMSLYAPLYELMVVADADGRIVAASTIDSSGRPVDTSRLLGADVHGERWFMIAKDGGLAEGETFMIGAHEDTFVAAVYADAGTESASYTYPIRDSDGKVIGVWTRWSPRTAD
jgi:hypothetical protein